MKTDKLAATAQAMVAKGKGILAIDESSGTIQKRFDSINVECTEATRRDYRDLLITTPGIGRYITGYILFDETIRQATTKGVPFPKVLEKAGVMPGIKVDAGAKPLAGHRGEMVTEGLDKLRERLAEYRKLGARFCKWRSVITIGNGIPSRSCIMANAHGLARYAALCQEAGLVPMVEPEVLLDGSHSIDRCYEASEATLRALFNELYEQRVALEGTILKASMVISGNKAAKRAGVQEVADRTVACLKASVPASLAGVVFLSGGQGDLEATQHLNAMNASGDNLPWPLSFSYSRALQGPALKSWNGKADNVKAAQAVLLHRAKMNGAATRGKYSTAMEKA
jgi:fructose-bisphosphate aldolase class I